MIKQILQNELKKAYKQFLFKAGVVKNMKEYEKFINFLKEYYDIERCNFKRLTKMKNTYRKLYKKFKVLNDFEIPEDIEYLSNKLFKDFGIKTFIVGGAIRDFIKGRDVKDYDLVTDANNFNYLKEALKELNIPFKESGERFFVLNIKLNDTYEITVFRKDTDNSKGEVGTIEDDANRRDFTVNAIYFDVIEKEFIDVLGISIEDVFNNKLRFIGNAKERIKEDSNRVFRFYRFIGEKGFEPENKSLRAVRENFDFAIKNTKSPRIMNEIERMIGIK